jgi:hypothetical protein
METTPNALPVVELATTSSPENTENSEPFWCWNRFDWLVKV